MVARVIAGRCILHGEIARGAGGSVHFARLVGAKGFARVVAVKKLVDGTADDAAAMLIDEARLVSRIQHPNVVSVHEILTEGSEIFVVMDYVHGETLSHLRRAESGASEKLEPALASAIASDVLRGLHAAHDATDSSGSPLGIVHRDVSPQNILVGIDGVARIADFGIAKATHRFQRTATGIVKGKLAYMAPEQLRGEPVDRRTDVFAAGIVLWELLAGKRLFASDTEEATIEKISIGALTPPSLHTPEVSEALDDVVMRALSSSPDDRFPDALAMSVALERALAFSGRAEIGEWVERRAARALEGRAREIEAIEREPLEVSATSAMVDAIPPRPSARRRHAHLVGALVLVVGGGALAMTAAPRKEDPKPTEAFPIAPSAPSATPLAVVQTTETPPPKPHLGLTPSRKSPPEAHRTAASSAPAKASAVARGADCKIPFDINADGQKVYKRHCL